MSMDIVYWLLFFDFFVGGLVCVYIIYKYIEIRRSRSLNELAITSKEVLIQKIIRNDFILFHSKDREQINVLIIVNNSIPLYSYVGKLASNVVSEQTARVSLNFRELINEK